MSRHWSSRSWVIATAATLALCLGTVSVAAQSPSAGGGAAGGPLTAHLYQDFTSFYPWSASGTGGDSLVMQLQWDRLAAFDETGQPQMRLAESIEPSEDAKTWTITLKEGLTWSDGEPLTSADVLYTWHRNANPNNSYTSGLWTNVVGLTDWQAAGDFTAEIPGITAPDERTVVFELIEPNAAFLASLLNFRTFILPAHVLNEVAPDIPTSSIDEVQALPFWQSPTVGAGPYLWQQTEPGQFLRFAPNPAWRGNPVAFSEVILRPQSDFAVAAADVQAGGLDIAVVTLDDLEGLEAAGLQTATALAPFPIQSDFNNSAASRFSDPKVRQAFMHGCDRQGFVDSFLYGLGLKTDTYFFPSWVPKDGIVDYNFDLDAAKALLDEAGFDWGTPVKWLSWNPDARDRQSFIEDCQAQMESIGVTIEIVNGLEVTNEMTAAGDWDLALYGGYPIADPDQIRQFTACTSIGTEEQANGFKWGGSNYTNYCNEEFDALMAQGATISDQAERAEIYKQAQDIFLADVPLMINWVNATAYAWSPNLKGVVPYGDPSQVFLKIDEWSKSE